MAKVSITCPDCQQSLNVKLTLAGGSFACPRCKRKWSTREVSELVDLHRDAMLDEQAAELQAKKDFVSSRVKELHDTGQVHQDMLTQLDAIRTHLASIRSSASWILGLLLLIAFLRILIALASII
jgi:hypothetical protein